MIEASVVSIEALHPEFNAFGQYMYTRMVSSGIRSFSALAARMDTEEYRVHRQTISKVAKGEQSVQPRFARRLASALGLTEEEKRELAWVLYRFG